MHIMINKMKLSACSISGRNKTANIYVNKKAVLIFSGSPCIRSVHTHVERSRG